MPTGKGGWAALHDIQERKRRERAEGPPLAVVPTSTPYVSRPVAGSQPVLGSQSAGGSQPIASSQPAEPPPVGPLSSQLTESSQPRVSRQPAPGHIKEDLKEIEKRGDASQCPDCAGSGWWYPQGTVRGVRLGCQHPRLKSTGE
jgi:hypothetical protein